MKTTHTDLTDQQTDIVERRMADDKPVQPPRPIAGVRMGGATGASRGPRRPTRGPQLRSA